MPPVQPYQQPMQMGGYGQQPASGMTGMPPMVQQVHVMPEPKKSHSGLIMIIVIVFLSLLLVTFVGLFIWKYLESDEIQATVDEQIDYAVAKAKDEQAQELEKKFSEREKNPYQTFRGPDDYGALTFKYPKTWSVYIAAPATTGGDFSAIMNPKEVEVNKRGSIYALRVTIQNKSFETVVEQYKKEMERKNSTLEVQTIQVNRGTVTANRYIGPIPKTEQQGIVVIFKIRDKTAILQTDSSKIFGTDFDTLIETVEFNV